MTGCAILVQDITFGWIFLLPVGVIANSVAVAVGGVVGAAIGPSLPERIRTSLPTVFGFSSCLIGISLAAKVVNLAPVILSMILGLLIGELLFLSTRIENGIRTVQKKLHFELGDADYMERFTTLLLLFCASGTGVFGALTEGMTGNSSILLAKTILDFFTVIIFASTMGRFLSVIAVPQFVVMLTLFLLARVIYPLMSADMTADFSALGGILTMMAGFNLLRIKQTPVLNLLPAFLLCPILSKLWSMVF